MFWHSESTETDNRLAERLWARLESAVANRAPAPQRVFLFARADAPCPHSGAPTPPACGSSIGRRRPRRPSPPVTEQPCLHALARAKR